MALTLENYYLSKKEPFQSCLLALRQLILSIHPEIEAVRLFQIPFFKYKGRKIGYLWLNGKKLMLGFCLDKSLQERIPGEKTKDKYESFRIDPDEDLPVEFIITRVRWYLARIDE